VLNKKQGAKGHWGFPKGHTENGENEYEAAAREIYEETGILVVFSGKTRVVSTYSPKEGVTKDAVYFLAAIRNNQEIKLQKSEIAEFRWCGSAEAKRMLTYDAHVLDKLEQDM
ncbi:MAG: NUDIX domain-containing protein, partial [Clostridiales bacterium]|nr:NUDIX domain-containing protein [Clostridiales bacterium]